MTIELIHGDALEVLAKLPDASVDMVFMDPPYGHNNNNNGDLISRWEAALGRGDYVAERDDRPIANDGPEANTLFRAALPQVRRLLSPGCCCCCCCCGGGGPDPQFARWSMWLDEAIGFKQMVVWDKGGLGMGWHYRRNYETVLVGMVPGAACRWHDDSHKVPNVIRFPKIIPSATQHPTEKPVELAAFFLNLHTQPGDTVLDPFMGSGTTGVAARQLGRSFIGIEIDEHWFNVAKDRIESTPEPLFV